MAGAGRGFEFQNEKKAVGFAPAFEIRRVNATTKGVRFLLGVPSFESSTHARLRGARKKNIQKKSNQLARVRYPDLWWHRELLRVAPPSRLDRWLPWPASQVPGIYRRGTLVCCSPSPFFGKFASSTGGIPPRDLDACFLTRQLENQNLHIIRLRAKIKKQTSRRREARRHQRGRRGTNRLLMPCAGRGAGAGYR